MTDIYNWPRAWDDVASGSFWLASRNQSSQSSWSGRVNVFGPHSQLWQCQVQLNQQFDEVNFEISSFFSLVGGPKGLIRMGHIARPRPQYDVEQDETQEPWSDDTFFDDGTGWLDGALPASIYCASAQARGDTSVIVGGLPVSTARVLRRGDLVEFKRNGIADETPSLHEIVKDAPTDSSGETRIEFRPALRKGVAIGDQVSLRYPTTVFRLADDNQGQINYTPPIIGSVGFSLIEAII